MPLPAQILGLNLDDATPWQRNLLAHTHVFDNERCGTVLLFDSYGKPATSIGAICMLKIPINLFAPAHRVKLFDYVQSFYKNWYGDARGIDIIAASAVAARVIQTSIEQLDTRPIHYRYIATREEELQILKIFVEANKYPSVTAMLFGDTPTLPEILVTYPDRDNAEHLLYEKSAGGFYAGRTNIIGIADYHPRACRFIVAEEIFHALDRPPFIERPRFEERDVDDLLEQANHVLHSYFADKFYGSDAKPGKYDFKMKDFRERTSSTFRNKFPSHSDKEVALLLLAEQRLLRRVGNFKNQSGYNVQPKTWDKELFAKLATLLVLRRHVHRNNNVELERRTEVQLFATNAGRAVIGQLDILDGYYKQRPQAERDQAERFAEQAAKALEAHQPEFKKRGYQRLARQSDSMGR